MLDLENRSHWSAGLFPGYDRGGEFQLTLVFKAGYSFDASGGLTPLPETARIEAADRYRGEPGESSLAAASESVPFKKGGELILSGTAYPPGNSRTVMEASVRIRMEGDHLWEKTVRVFGRRCWKKKFMSATPGSPGPLGPTPLIYEHAYGGASAGNSEKIFPPNPVGKGYSETGWRIGRLDLPELEVGPKFITAPGQRVDPAGFGPIAPTWEPRLSDFRAFDPKATAWGGPPFGKATPADLWNAAPHDQRFPRPFRGGETLHLQGLVKDAPVDGVQFRVPVLRPKLHLIVDGGVRSLLPCCDTLRIDADRQVIELIWRAGVLWQLTSTQKGWIVLRDLDLEERDE